MPILIGVVAGVVVGAAFSWLFHVLDGWGECDHRDFPKCIMTIQAVVPLATLGAFFGWVAGA